MKQQDRFNAALKALRARGVVVRQNVPGCCRSCIAEEALGLTPATADTTPYVWTYGGQGGRYRWCDDVPVLRSNGRPLACIYFNHGGPGVQAAAMLEEELKRVGLRVEWDGTPERTVTVSFDATEEEQREAYVGVADELNDGAPGDCKLEDLDEYTVQQAEQYAKRCGFNWPPAVGDFDRYWEAAHTRRKLVPTWQV